jgi:hypothetical protein
MHACLILRESYFCILFVPYNYLMVLFHISIMQFIPNECYSGDGSCAVNIISMVIFVLPLLCHSIGDMYTVIVYHVSSAWSIQRHRHNWVHQTQNKDKQNKKTQHIKLERGGNTDHTKTGREPRC